MTHRGAAGDALTSVNNPIEVGWINFGLLPTVSAPTGRLGMTFLPGKRADGMAGRHERDLEMDVTRLRDVHGVDTLVLLVEDHELTSLGAPGIVDVVRAHGIDVIRHPIVDAGVPTDAVTLRVQLHDVADRVAAGQNVVVACRGGLGRTGTFVALVLRTLGADTEAAMAATRSARRGAIENARQERFVTEWRTTAELPSDVRVASEDRLLASGPRYVGGFCRRYPGTQRLIQVGDQVLDRLDPDGQADHVRAGAGGDPLLVGELAMGRRGGVEDQ